MAKQETMSPEKEKQEEGVVTESQEEVKADAADSAVEELSQQVEEAQKKAEENWSQYLRANAEMENLRRRQQRDLENAHKFALEKFAQELLPVKDSLEMGLAAVASAEGEDIAKLKEGTELTLKMLADAMGKFGIAEVNPEGEAFNPELHQAMSMQESAETKPNTVLAVMQKGYLLNERLIRPAMVVVSKAAEK